MVTRLYLWAAAFFAIVLLVGGCATIEHATTGPIHPKEIKPACVLTSDQVAAIEEKVMLGDPIAMVFLGDLYSLGKCVEHDVNLAISLYNRALSIGETLSLRRLGNVYRTGYPDQAIPKDYAKAFDYFYRASEAGDMEAMESVAIAYRYGEGVTKDNAQAIDWYIRAGKPDSACY